jgi:ABC-2 type transport system permease protein
VRAFLRVARLEGRLLASDGSVWILLIAFAAAIVFAVWNGAKVFADRERAIASFTTVERERLAQSKALAIQITDDIQHGKPPTAYWNATKPATATFDAEISAVLPLSPLAALALGDADVVPGAFRSISAGRTVPESVPSAPQTTNPLKALLGTIDLGFVVMYLAPLVVLSLCYGLIAEKEAGVLPIVLSQPVRLGTIIAAKLSVRLGLFACVAGAVTFAVVAMALPDALSPAWRGPLAAWLATAGVYALFWFALATAIVASGRSAIAAALVTGTFWLAWVFFEPSAVTAVARAIRPVSPRAAVVSAKRASVIRAGGHRILEQQKELREPDSPSNRLIAAYFAAHPQLDAARQSFDDRYRMVFFVKMMEADRLAAPTEARWTAERDAQFGLIERLRVLSPATLLSATLVDVSGTSRRRYNDFLAQVDDHRRTWIDWVIARYASAPLLVASDYDRLPQFAYIEEPASRRRVRALTNSAMLTAATAALFTVGIIRFRRYSIVV